jgi:murein DD-endopeptidase MepM/ murein hydrolase activator NlpD
LPKKSKTSFVRARIHALPTIPIEHSPQLPALNGRSVRTLRQVRAVKAVRAAVGSAALAFAALIGLALGVPAYAAATAPVPVTEAAAQSLAVPRLATPVVITRDTYGVTVPPPLVWPVDPSSPISDGFGPRVSPCGGCSSNHEGVDYDAGFGAQVHAIAAGVVVETNNPGWSALGIHVAIQHVIDGQVVTSAYGHMQVGSMHLRVGDAVFPGEVVGLVGNTGASTGAHLHFEIRSGGSTPVDPLAWMHSKLG